MESEVNRGKRSACRVDFSTAKLEINQFGVGVLSPGHDSISGADAFALDWPADLTYPEEAHFYV